MKFGKLLNSSRDKERHSSGRDLKNGHIGRATEERSKTKKYDTTIPIVSSIHHSNIRRTFLTLPNSDLADITNPRPAPKPPQQDIRTPETLQRKPDPPIPGYTSLAQRHQQQPHQVSPEAPWSSRFSDSTGRSAPPHDTGGPAAEPELPPLQLSSEASGRARGLQPLHESAVDPDSFDLAAPAPAGWEEQPQLEPLERRSLLMFSKTHLRLVFADLKLLRRFSVFLMEHRPEHVPLLVYHLDVRKALAAIRYTNSVTGLLKPMDGLAFTRDQAPATVNEGLVQKLEESFRVLANEDLPAWITSVWMRAVEVSIRRRINGSLPSQLRE